MEYLKNGAMKVYEVLKKAVDVPEESTTDSRTTVLMSLRW